MRFFIYSFFFFVIIDIAAQNEGNNINSINKQSILRKKNTIKFNAFQWTVEDFRFIYEFSPKKKNSFQVRLGFRDNHILKTILDDGRKDLNDFSIYNSYYRCKGFNVGLAYHDYQNKKWYIQYSGFYSRYLYEFASDIHWKGLYDYNSKNDLGNYIYEYTKNVAGIQVNTVKLLTQEGVHLEAYAGIGARLKWRHFNYVDRSLWVISTGKDILFTPSVHLGINVCFSF